MVQALVTVCKVSRVSWHEELRIEPESSMRKMV
jgi:hypothetical protein